METTYRYTGSQKIIIALVVFVFSAIGIGGYVVWKSNSSQTTNNSNAEPDTRELANGAIEVSGISDKWKLADLNEKPCPYVVTTNTCVDSMFFVPKDDRVESSIQFGVHINVYDNPENQSPDAWYESDVLGIPIGNDTQKSEISFNGLQGFKYVRTVADDVTERITLKYALRSDDNNLVLAVSDLERRLGSDDASDNKLSYQSDVEALIESLSAR